MSKTVGFFYLMFVGVLSLNSCSDASEKANTDKQRIDGDSAVKVAVRSNYIRREVTLLYDAGKLSIFLPPELDTFYFSKMNGEFFPNTFLYEQKSYKDNHGNYNGPDSLYQFKIYQSYKMSWDQGRQIDSILLSEEKAKSYASDHHKDSLTKFYVDTINNRKYIVSIYSGKRNMKDDIEIWAITIIDGNRILCGFDCYKTNADGFIKRMLISLRTLVIENDKADKPRE